MRTVPAIVLGSAPAGEEGTDLDIAQRVFRIGQDLEEAQSRFLRGWINAMGLGTLIWVAIVWAAVRWLT
ncbi:MAG: hypothetical protein E7K72_11865 [Roseomonas mucosa]|nr:hypothetical protein [Roseomonas mucosa]